MLPQARMYEYRGWPSERAPHAETLHHLFGVGVAEIRTDTYILAARLPHLLMVIRGGTRFEIKEKIGDHEPAAAWILRGACAFPLRRNVVNFLQGVFPHSRLPSRIFAPVDLISWVGDEAFVWNVSKRMVQFHDAACTAELAVVNAHGRRAETFSVKAKRYEAVSEILRLLPAHRLPNLDYGAWLEPRVRDNRTNPDIPSPQDGTIARPVSVALQRLKRSVAAGKRWLEQSAETAVNAAPVDRCLARQPFNSRPVFQNPQSGAFRTTASLRQPYQIRSYCLDGCDDIAGAGDDTHGLPGKFMEFGQQHIPVYISVPDRDPKVQRQMFAESRSTLRRV